MSRPLKVLHVLTTLLPFFAVTSLSLAAASPTDVAEAAKDNGGAHLRATLLSNASLVAAGDDFELGVLFDLDPGWHIYWHNPGEAGLPTRISWNAPDVEVGDIEWPVPSVFRESGGVITTYGYAQQVLLAVPAKASPDAKGEVHVEARVSALACSKVCIPAHFTLSHTLTVGDATTPDEQAGPRFNERLLPQKSAAAGVDVEVVYSQSGVRPGDHFRAAIAAIPRCAGTPNCTPLQLATTPAEALVAALPADIELAKVNAATHPASHEGVLLQLEASADKNVAATAEASTFSGVLRLTRAGQQLPIAFVAPLPRAASGDKVVQNNSPLLRASADTAAQAPVRQVPLLFLQMLLFAFVGGLILNLMPCVLPVLFLKVVSVARLAHSERHLVLKHDIAYAAGILASMLALGALVASLRAFGAMVGWGFQFQSPVFASVLAVVLLLFALSLFGVFNVEIGAASLSSGVGRMGGQLRSFFEGVLMVVVATPCTAPFLGSAVGFALVRSPLVILATFGAIGLGLAAPFVLLTLIPGLARIVPKPGAWMERLRELLGFALLATVLWLLWLVGRFAGADGVLQVLLLLLCAAFAAWIFGALQRQRARVLLRCAGTVFLVLLLLVAGRYLTPTSTNAQPSSTHSGAWQPYSQAALDKARQAGRPVFVNFTADWCITCKVNEKTVFSQPEVQEVLTSSNTALLLADWTRRDEAIRAELARFGRAGVPMYLVYAPGDAQPVLLPEILTPGVLIDAIRHATGTHTRKL